MQLPELWLPKDTMSPLSFLSLDTGRWICAINSLLSKILEIIQGLSYSGEQKNLNYMEHNRQQRAKVPQGLCRGEEWTWEHFFPVSLVPTGSCTPQFPVSTALTQCHHTALLPEHEKVWHRDTWVALE